MQVAAADTYTDYVICRGFDPRMRKFINYAAGDSDNPGISVAKPFGSRVKGQYHIGQVFPSFLPTQGTATYVPPCPTAVDWRIGQNPGAVAASTDGHPQALVTAISALTDHNDKYVNWMLIQSGRPIRRFELKDAHTPGATSTAYLLVDDGGLTVDTDVEFEVTDKFGIYRGRAKDAYADPNHQGSRGLAEYFFDSNEWHILWMTPHALMIRGQATAAWTAATFTIDTLKVMQPTGAIIVDQDPGGNITVYDIFDWDGVNNADVVAAWNENTDHWEAIQVSC